MKKTKYIILSSAKEDSIGGIVILETQDGKTTCFVSLYGVKDFEPTLLVDDLVNVRQFSVSPSFSEIDIDGAVGSASDLVVGLFDKNHNLLASGSTFGSQTSEQKERLLVAIEKKGMLEHFVGLADEAFCRYNAGKTAKEATFLQQTEMLLFELFAYGVPDSSIARFVPNSKWVKLFLKNDVVGVGVVEGDAGVFAVGLAFPVMSKNQRRRDIDANFKFFPQNPSKPNGFGYYIVLQNAKDGTLVNFG